MWNEVIYNHEMHVIIDLGFSRIVQEYNGDSADRNLFYRLFISVCHWRFIYQEGSVVIPLTGLNCHLGFQRHRWWNFVCHDFSWEVIVYFIDISGIVGHHYLNFVS